MPKKRKTRRRRRRGGLGRLLRPLSVLLTAVAVVCAVMLIYDLVFRDSIVLAYTKKMISILAPILYGFAMAYLLAALFNAPSSTGNYYTMLVNHDLYGG